MDHSDEELIKRTLAGDEAAFGSLVDRYKGAVHALVYRKIGDFHTAEELTQDAFLQAYLKLSTLRNLVHYISRRWASVDVRGIFAQRHKTRLRVNDWYDSGVGYIRFYRLMN